MNALVRGVARRSLVSPLFLYPAMVIGLVPLVLVVVTDLDVESQALFGILTVALMFILDRFRSRWVTLLLIVLSVTVSSRYLWWRLTSTLDFASWPEAFLGTGLIMAELYAWLVLFLGFMQSAWPLERRPLPLPANLSSWPTVDVFIPTYNEPLSVVQNTVLGALNMDYPADKMRVYILDDGRREEFRRFAEEAGAGYITRPDNQHAKAGNLNHALRLTDGEFVACFDADHVPTRAFLQMALGWFRRDSNLALVQTPHHFYSPDPFERNLSGGNEIPNEGQLFYGLIQEGNDFWNAAFFCGSAAVLRRTALEDIGGFAVETVTEDAHTALKLHRRGYNSAYLRLPLSAGLATERLALHMGQRMRWARGMTQIFRLDNPLLGRGLTLAQRFCYLNAMLHFFFALPRFVFLTAPLAFLLFQQNIIAATALAILVYAGPHLMHSWVTNSRVQSRYRYSFWGDVYESVLAFYILKPTLVTLINPRKGRFNVTEKGGLLPHSYFDGRYVAPQVLLIFFLSFGLFVGILRILFQEMPALDLQVLLLNMAWATFNVVTLLGAIVVAVETRQVRSHVRMRLQVPSILHLPDGNRLALSSEDISMGGALFRVPEGISVNAGDPIRVDLEVEPGRLAPVRARTVVLDGNQLRLRFEGDSIEEQRSLVRVVFGRADAWLDWDARAPDRPLRSIGRIFGAIFGGLRGYFASKRGRMVTGTTGRPVERAETRERRGARASRNGLLGRLRGRAAATSTPGLATAALAATLAFALGSAALAQTPAPRPTGQEALDAPPPPPRIGPRTLTRPGSDTPDTPDAPALPDRWRTGDDAGPVPGQDGVPGQPPPSRGAMEERRFDTPGSPFLTPADQAAGRPGRAATRASAARPGLVEPTLPVVEGQRRDVATLEDMGAASPIRLEGVYDQTSLRFSVRRDEVVTDARVVVNFSYSPALIPEISHLHVLLNDEVVGSAQLVKELADGATLELPVNPALFQEENRIRFDFVGHYTLGCEDPMHSSLWAILSNSTAVEMVKERLPLRNDLSLLPLPFFDINDMSPLTLPFVLPGSPSDDVLEAAGIVASYFGREARFRGASFPTTFSGIPRGNAVVIGTGGQQPDGLTLPAVDGPTLSVVTNPSDPNGKLLLILGNTAEEAVAAAQALALAGDSALSGATARVSAPEIEPREPLEAPYWIPLDRPVRLGELINEVTDLQGVGMNPGVLTVNFQTAPGVFAWRDAGIPMVVRYRYPGQNWLDFNASRLDVLINNAYLRSLELERARTAGGLQTEFGLEFVQNEATVAVPPSRVFGRNQLQFHYDLMPVRTDECADGYPRNVRSAIDPESTIDFSGALRMTTLPNLAFFVNSGYPFTHYADLSRSAIVLPDQVSEDDVQAFLATMALMGESTGYPVVNAVVVRGSEIETVRDRDLLVIGSFGRQAALGELTAGSQFVLDGNQLRVRLSSPIDRLYTLLDPEVSYADQAQQRRRADELLTTAGADIAGMVSFESPYRSDRTVVAITSTQPEGLVDITRAVRSRDLMPLVQGDMVVLRGNRLASFRVGDTYTAEAIPFWHRIRWYFADRPLVLISFLLLGVVLVSIALLYLLRRVAAVRLRRPTGT